MIRYIVFVIIPCCYQLSSGNTVIPHHSGQVSTPPPQICIDLFNELESKLEGKPGLWNLFGALCTTELVPECHMEVLGYAAAYVGYVQRTKYKKLSSFAYNCSLENRNCEPFIGGVMKHSGDANNDNVDDFFIALCAQKFPADCEQDVIGMIEGYMLIKLEDDDNDSAEASTTRPTGKARSKRAAKSNSECDWSGFGVKKQTSGAPAASAGEQRFESAVGDKKGSC